jgi:hypothetical protein
MNITEGHRERLRQRFRENPTGLSDTERLELFLTYIIPRKNVAPLAENLIAQFGDLIAAITAPVEQLSKIEGVGESTITFFQLFQSIISEVTEALMNMSPEKQNKSVSQLSLFVENELEASNTKSQARQKQHMDKKRQMRVFANDEIVNSLDFLPRAADFKSLEDFKRYLNEKLPYNAAETRQRRANYIIERFFDDDNVEVPLIYFASHCSNKADLKPVVFYHIVKAEPIATKVADEFVWPALPVGHVDREQLREFIPRYLPEVRYSSQKKILRALFNTYDLLEIGSTQDTTLRFQLHQGTLESFLYILTAEYPKPGIYSFESLFNGPLHRWMLWDREWLRKQLYNLGDLGILSKISEIDTVRQFSLAVDQSMALKMFYEQPHQSNGAVRETFDAQSEGQED